MTEFVRPEAARVTVIAEGRVLLLHTRDPRPAGSDVWELPGGGLKEGEFPVDGPHREPYEETGSVADVLGPRLGGIETDFRLDGRLPPGLPAGYVA